MEAQTKGELISQIRNELRMANSDASLTNKLIWSIIQKHMEWLIKRENSKLGLLTQESIFQTYKCIDVTDAPAIDECCGIRSKCKVFRTKNKIPTLFEDTNGVIIKSVFTIDGSRDFNMITINEYMRKLENPHSKYDKSLYFFYNNGYLYFPKSTIRKVMIKGYFVDELDNSQCAVCPENDTPCISKLDTPIRIPRYLLGELMSNVLNELSQLTLKIQQDESIEKNENIRN